MKDMIDVLIDFGKCLFYFMLTVLLISVSIYFLVTLFYFHFKATIFVLLFVGFLLFIVESSKY